MNLRLDVIYRELNGKFETMDAHVMMLDTQVSQTTGGVKMQEALVKEKAEKRKRNQVNDILDDDLEQVIKDEKLEEDAFLVESSMYFGSSHWSTDTNR